MCVCFFLFCSLIYFSVTNIFEYPPWPSMPFSSLEFAIFSPFFSFILLFLSQAFPFYFLSLHFPSLPQPWLSNRHLVASNNIDSFSLMISDDCSLPAGTKGLCPTTPTLLTLVSSSFFFLTSPFLPSVLSHSIHVARSWQVDLT